MIKKLLILYCLFLFIGCQNRPLSSIRITEISVGTQHSGEPNLTVGSSGDLYLTWVEYVNDSLDILQFSRLDNNSWSEPKTIAQGNDWFVNWADFPSLLSVDESHLIAHWLQNSSDGKYDYDIRLSQSYDNGLSWTSSMIPHRDSIDAEHGFVSMLATPEGKTFVVWLDGRHTKGEKKSAMTLRSAEIDRDGTISNEVELDQRVCDCCQTGATWTPKGPIVVYRDRSENEIRDIGIVRKVEEKWTSPEALFDDNWKIAGCPVNGPSIASKENIVVVAWFTISEDQPKVLASISQNYGEDFSDPIIIDKQSPLGRVDAIIHNNQVMVSWMSTHDTIADINLVSIDSGGKLSQRQKVGSNIVSRSSGFPRMESINNSVVMAWTDASDSTNIVKTYKIDFNHE